jgi:DNA modification methylase
MLAFALRADGWYLRSDIIWSKPNPMPESVTDRPTKAHEYVFLLSKSQRYFYDAEAIKEQSSENTHPRLPGNVNPPKGQSAYENGDGLQRTKAGLLAYANRKRAEAGSGIKNNDSFDAAMAVMPSSRNRRTVWTIATAPYSEAHFATFPPDLIKPCILAGTSARGCCPKCGAGWVRILERQESAGKKDYNGKHSQSDPSSAGRNILASVNAARKAGGAHDNPFPGKKTTGWAPACECGCADVVPATVLDPFGGSGTTGKVALELGRSAVLIDLNPEYLTMIESRTNVTPGLAL